MPLIFIIVVGAVKVAYEDDVRHKADRKVNQRKVKVLRDGRIETVLSMDLCVGDVVRVAKNDPFPCDLVLLCSALPSGDCFATTSGLDGETNLKVS